MRRGQPKSNGVPVASIGGRAIRTTVSQARERASASPVTAGFDELDIRGSSGYPCTGPSPEPEAASRGQAVGSAPTSDDTASAAPVALVRSTVAERRERRASSSAAEGAAGAEGAATAAAPAIADEAADLPRRWRRPSDSRADGIQEEAPASGDVEDTRSQEQEESDSEIHEVVTYTSGSDDQSGSDDESISGETGGGFLSGHLVPLTEMGAAAHAEDQSERNSHGSDVSISSLAAWLEENRPDRRDVQDIEPQPQDQLREDSPTSTSSMHRSLEEFPQSSMVDPPGSPFTSLVLRHAPGVAHVTGRGLTLPQNPSYRDIQQMRDQETDYSAPEPQPVPRLTDLVTQQVEQRRRLLEEQSASSPPPGVDIDVWRELPLEARLWALSERAHEPTTHIREPPVLPSPPVASSLLWLRAHLPQTRDAGIIHASTSVPEVRHELPHVRPEFTHLAAALGDDARGGPVDHLDRLPATTVAAAAPELGADPRDDVVSPGGSSMDGSGATSCCIVCQDAPAVATFVHGQTGHTACCLPCARELERRGSTCPVCRQPFSMIIRNFN